MTVFTIGHSIRPLADFLALLEAYGIRRLADVRTVPRSRRHPHFSQQALSKSLTDAGIDYCHLPQLGGLRKPRRHSRNTVWKVEGFRGYADYMETPEFDRALDELQHWAEGAPTAVMCAESLWWRCHRRLIADALVAKGVEVRHISTETSAPVHTVTPFARLTDKRVRYDGLLG